MAHTYTQVLIHAIFRNGPITCIFSFHCLPSCRCQDEEEVRVLLGNGIDCDPRFVFD